VRSRCCPGYHNSLGQQAFRPSLRRGNAASRALLQLGPRLGVEGDHAGFVLGGFGVGPHLDHDLLAAHALSGFATNVHRLLDHVWNLGRRLLGIVRAGGVSGKRLPGPDSGWTGPVATLARAPLPKESPRGSGRCLVTSLRGGREGLESPWGPWESCLSRRGAGQYNTVAPSGEKRWEPFLLAKTLVLVTRRFAKRPQSCERAEAQRRVTFSPTVWRRSSLTARGSRRCEREFSGRSG